MKKHSSLRRIGRLAPRRISTLRLDLALAETASQMRLSKDVVDSDIIHPFWDLSLVLFLNRYIEGRSATRVFEYGSGRSSRWLASKGCEVLSVEHDPTWLPTEADQSRFGFRVLHRPSTGDPVYAPENDPYAGAIEQSKGLYDLVIVDGLSRMACVERSLPFLAPAGLLVLDDSFRASYDPIHEYVAAAGFTRLDFVGLKQGHGHLCASSVYFKYGSAIENLKTKPVSTYFDGEYDPWSSPVP